MSDENEPTGGTPGKDTPEAVEQIVLGEGNILTKQNALDLIQNNKNLKGELDEAREILITVKGNLDTAQQGVGNATQAKIQAEVARDAALAKVKELEGVTQNYISPDKYQELQSKVGTMEWEGLVERVKRLSTTYKVDESRFHGKTVAELDAMEAGLELGGSGKSKEPKLDGGTTGGGDVVSDNQFNANIEKNKEILKALREKGSKHND